jgi:proteasome lid subunit RPN8/RPN11
MSTISVLSPVDLTQDHPVIQRIQLLAQEAEDPTQELCGVIVPDLDGRRGSHVIVVPNRAEEPHTSFRMLGSDLRFALEKWFKEADTALWREVIFWHTHPGGGIGPSRTDMQNKPPSGYSLVVSLTPEGPIPTLY